MKRVYRVYKITNMVNGNFYIGYTGLPLMKRFRCHANSKNAKYPIARAFSKYGKDAFVIEEIKTFDTKEAACQYEIHLIEELKPIYNAHPGGTGGAQYGEKNPLFGKRRSNEWKQQKSLSMSGSNNPMYGQTHTPEARQKIRESRIGVPSWNKGKTGIYDEVTLEKMRKPKSQQHREKLSQEFSFISPSGEVVKIKGLLTFCTKMGLHPGAMSQVFHGKRTQHKGWRMNKENKE